jgi:hypothetical protein
MHIRLICIKFTHKNVTLYIFQYRIDVCDIKKKKKIKK